MTMRRDIRRTCAQTLGLHETVTIEAVVDSDTVSIPALADLSPDADRMRDAYLWVPAVAQWRRILSYGYPANTDVGLSRSLPNFTTPASAEIYFLLNPDEWNSIINDTLVQFTRESSVDIALVANTRLYDLSAASPAIKRRGQIVKLAYVNTLNGESAPVGSVTYHENNDTVSAVINESLPDVTVWQLRVTFRDNYSPLPTDTVATACPTELWRWGIVVAAIQRIKGRYGPQIGRLFGERGVLAEREFLKAKDAWLPRAVATDYYHDEAWGGPDLNPNIRHPAW